MGIFGKKHHPRILKTEKISYADLFFILRLSRGDLTLRPIFIAASVELGNSTTKSILTATDLKTGKTYILDKAVKMTREAQSDRDSFCHTLSLVDLSEESIADLVKRTLQDCAKSAGITTPDLHFVVRSTGVTACFSKIEEVEGVIKALAKGCMLAGVPPRKMISPMTVENIAPELRKYSRMERTYFDGAVTGNIPPAGESIVGNEMEGELVTAGLKEAAKWLDVDYRNPALSLDFGTTLAGRITDDGLPYARVIGSFCGLAGAIQIYGLHHRMFTDGSATGFTGSAGFNGIVVALFGQLHPLGAIPASFLFGALIVGANKLQRVMQVPSSFIIALNGLVVVFVVSADYWRRRMARRREAVEVGEMIESSEAEVPT